MVIVLREKRIFGTGGPQDSIISVGVLVWMNVQGFSETEFHRTVEGEGGVLWYCPSSPYWVGSLRGKCKSLSPKTSKVSR